MKLNTQRPSRKGFTLVELLVVMAIIAVLASIATPLVLRKTRDGDKTKAIAHAKQCQLAFFDFEQEYGTRPGLDAVALLPTAGAAAAATSNDAFRQLLVGLTTVRTEAIFFAPSKGVAEPDNDIGEAPDFATACAPGEVTFLYVDAPDSKTGAPLVTAPLVAIGGTTYDFEKYNGKGVMLKTDGSVITPNINEDTLILEITVAGAPVDAMTIANKTFRTAPTLLTTE